MKKSTYLLLTIICLAACKKDNPVVEDPNLLHLTFTGTVVNQQTQAPIAQVPVHVIYGTKCCGSIEVVKGSDSTITNSEGVYTLKVSYPKPSAAYRHFVHVPGYFDKFFYNQKAYKRHAEWMTIGHNESAVLPIDLADTVKIVDGYVSVGKIEILPAGTISLRFPYTIVPATDSLTVSTVYSASETNHFPLSFLPNKSVNYLFEFLELPVLANKQIFIKTDVYEAGSGIFKKMVVDSVTLAQGQVYNYDVHY